MTTDQRKPFAPTRPGRYELRNGRLVEIICSRNEFQHIKIWFGYLSGDDHLSPISWAYDGTWELDHTYDIIGFAPDDREWCLARARELAQAHGFVVVPSEATEAWFDAQQAFYAAVPSHQHGHMEWCERMEAALKVIAAAVTGEGE